MQFRFSHEHGSRKIASLRHDYTEFYPQKMHTSHEPWLCLCYLGVATRRRCFSQPALSPAKTLKIMLIAKNMLKLYD